MNHRKLHLLNPTVYSYCHSNPWLVKTELIYCWLSPAPSSARSTSSLWWESQWGERWRHHWSSVFSPPCLPVVFLWRRNLSSFHCNPDCLPVPFVRWRWLFLTSDKTSCILPTRIPMAAKGWLPEGVSLDGHVRRLLVLGWSEWRRGGVRLFPSLFLSFASPPGFLLPPLPCLFSLLCYFLSRSTVTWTGQEMGGVKP